MEWTDNIKEHSVLNIGEVFKKSGVPTHTFVAPVEYDRVEVALATPGRGLIVEGPSGIGKTSCVKKVIEDLGVIDSCLFLSARVQGDIPLIEQLHTMQSVGIVVIDDFHRLPAETKITVSDFVKVLADEEKSDSKVVLIGINSAGQSLVEYAPDLLHRIETIRFGRTNVERIQELISLGETALNCSITIAQEIANEAAGSFAMAQVLSHEACLQGKLKVKHEDSTPFSVNVSLPCIREAVIADLHTRFFNSSREFATGKKLRKEGRAPYLHLLKWLAGTYDGVLDTKEALSTYSELKGSVGQVIEKGHLATLLSSAPTLSSLFHFDGVTQFLTVEDPKFLYFIRNIIWSKFAKQIGYFSIEFRSSYDFALSFAGEDRNVANAINDKLSAREISVFYDKNEQHRILANDVEEYLAPIYRSESQFIVVLMSNDYPKKLWTKFESEQFKDRFGDNSVIPIWFSNTTPSMFDNSRKYGGLGFDVEADLSEQVGELVEVLAQKLQEARESMQADQKTI